MKRSEVPEWAFNLAPTPLPSRLVVAYDWDALYETLLKQGFVIIESDDIRTTCIGAEECGPVKAFNTHMRVTRKIPLRTKRISANRWYCTL